MASREIMNLGHGLSNIKLQTDATEDADELMQNLQFQAIRLSSNCVTIDFTSSSSALTGQCSVNI